MDKLIEIIRCTQGGSSHLKHTEITKKSELGVLSELVLREDL
jgi:hypothetical protein